MQGLSSWQARACRECGGSCCYAPACGDLLGKKCHHAAWVPGRPACLLLLTCVPAVSHCLPGSIAAACLRTPACVCPLVPTQMEHLTDTGPDATCPCCSGANLMGYIKCSKAAQNQIKGKFQGLFASGLRAYMFGRS